MLRALLLAILAQPFLAFAVTWQLADLAMIGLTAALVVLTALHQWGGHRGAV